MIMGIGRGDSAVRYIGQPPVRVAEFERRFAMIRDFMNGKEVNWNDKELHLKWVRPELPPNRDARRRLRPEGARRRRPVRATASSSSSPTRTSSSGSCRTARTAAEEAGRDPAALKCIVSAPSHISDDIAHARDQVRWFPAMVSNHVKDLIERYGTAAHVVPHALTDYVEKRKFYDYDEHSRVGAKHGEFVTDEICDRFCVLGDGEQATAKLKELESIGVDQFNIYLMTEGQESTLEAYGSAIIPRFSGVAA